MCAVIIVEAAAYLCEIERFGCSVSDAEPPLRGRFVHRRRARLDVGKEGGRRGLADHQKMRFVGHFRNAENAAAVIESASIGIL